MEAEGRGNEASADVDSGSDPMESIRGPGGARRASDREHTPLFVDLDGTLVRTDLLYEAIAKVMLNPTAGGVRLISAFGAGRAAFKQVLAQLYTPDAASLPYCVEVLTFVKEQRQLGRPVILATASCRQWASVVADHLQLFDHVLASDSEVNLKGPAKLVAIRDYCDQRGFEGFAYIGDSRADVPIWQHASESYLSMPQPGVVKTLHDSGIPARILAQRKARWAATLRLLRPHQWSKNLLLFVPLLLSHQLSNLPLLLHAVLAFVSFSLVASSVYVVNDFVDFEFDRLHHRKCRRPFASGDIPLTHAIPLAGVTLGAGVLISLYFLPLGWLQVIAVYLLATVAYTTFFKRVVIADVVMLSVLYTLRVFGGGVACGIAVSDWLLTFSMFVFASLGFLKRYTELQVNFEQDVTASAGRGYEVDDLSLISVMGISCGMISVVVLSLYLQSDEVDLIYQHKRMLWMLCPILTYWICRVWLLARRKKVVDDPVAFALTDPVSLLVAGITGLLLFAASGRW